jgi:hypothetical protein
MVLELKTVDPGWLRITALRWRPFPNPCSRRAACLPTSADFADEVKWDGFRAVVSTGGTATGAESARRMALVVFPLADTADACYCANEFSLREVQQGGTARRRAFPVRLFQSTSNF